MENSKILIIEDEETIADILSYSLKQEGYSVQIAYEGKKGIELARNFSPDMILLDLMLPDISGFEVCKQISREFSIPIIMITAKSDMMDKIIGIELGADDYITKPFNIREVTARIRSIFRRIELTSEVPLSKEDSIIKLKNGVTINKQERNVMKDDIKIELTNKAFELLLFLAENKKIVFSRGDLLDKVWGFEYVGDSRTVDIHVQRVRKKLDDNEKSSIINTIFGVGYKYED